MAYNSSVVSAQSAHVDTTCGVFFHEAFQVVKVVADIFHSETWTGKLGQTCSHSINLCNSCLMLELFVLLDQRQCVEFSKFSSGNLK